jgi:hypothetical protein
LPDPQVVQCVLDLFSKLRFMPPSGGVVAVVYPTMLDPG